jgi:hypothetical protein
VKPTPNPSIEGTLSGLRPPSAPHVKRWASAREGRADPVLRRLSRCVQFCHCRRSRVSCPFGSLLLQRRRGLSVLRRPAHACLGSTAASNTLSSRLAIGHSITTPNRSLERTASQPLNSNVRALVSNTPFLPYRQSSSARVNAKSMAGLKVSRHVSCHQSKGVCVPRGGAVVGPALLRRAGSQVGSSASYARAAGVAAFGHALARRRQVSRSTVARLSSVKGWRHFERSNTMS